MTEDCYFEGKWCHAVIEVRVTSKCWLQEMYCVVFSLPSYITGDRAVIVILHNIIAQWIISAYFGWGWTNCSQSKLCASKMKQIHFSNSKNYDISLHRNCLCESYLFFKKYYSFLFQNTLCGTKIFSVYRLSWRMYNFFLLVIPPLMSDIVLLHALTKQLWYIYKFIHLCVSNDNGDWRWCVFMNNSLA